MEPRIDKCIIPHIENLDLLVDPVNFLLLVDILRISNPAVVAEPGQLGRVHQVGDGYGVLIQARLGI